ncbi:unnamed protein product [Angiostrongylus costaricensis]|uniref:tRNA pseudouridine synthase n=1 Tax=Angiostrongylus costaricensis TaxID=334426 RepID=A0A0R3PK97_ANGCS|nr:unnamed protein product [Angiostrongylus costaricensis]
MCSAAEENVPSQPAVKRKRFFDFEAHPRRKIAIQFLYYGWEFDGLVQQANTENTVEKHLMDALLKTKLIFDEKNCDFSRCGRTDKGVSAFKQVAALVVRSADVNGKFVFWHDDADKSVIENYPEKEELSYLKMLNGVLPSSVRVMAWAPVPRDFSARHACNMRVYKYSLPRANLNLEVMREACNLLVGTHDFRNFCQVDMNEKRVNMSFVRELFEVSIEPISANESFSGSSRNELVELTIQGSGFLWHMIRARIVENMLNGIIETPLASHMDLDKGLLQFTQSFLTLKWVEDRPLPSRYIKFAERKTCDSVEQKREKLEKKREANGDKDCDGEC